MKVITTKEATVGDSFGAVATYNGDNWYGDKTLVSMVSHRSREEVTGYRYDPILNYVEYVCSKYPELSIISSKTIEEEYPDNTVFWSYFPCFHDADAKLSDGWREGMSNLNHLMIDG